MPTRIVQFLKSPWTGGINTAVDPGALPDNDLQIADNVVFTTSGSRKKREGISYFDEVSAPPSVISRSSSGTTRTLVFDASLIIVSPANQKLVVGERIEVTTTASSGNQLQYVTSASNAIIISITTTTLSNDTITYTFTGAASLTEGATATSQLFVTRNASYIDLMDYWRYDADFVKQQLLMAFSDQGKMFYHDVVGRRVEVISGATPYTSAITKATSIVFNDRYIVCVDGESNQPVYYRPESSATFLDVGGDVPNSSIVQEHLGRVWMNDKENRDRLHYSSTGDSDEWGGVGDSGAIDIVPGDGDPDGITAIYKSFKGTLFVAKGTKLYRIDGDSPENFAVTPVTKGLGCVNHKAAASVDLDDVVFMSKKGVHTLATTQSYGDFQQSFLSAKIQPTFTSRFNPLRFSYVQSAYVPDLNAVFFAVSENNEEENNDLYVFNVINKEWCRWPDLSCQSIATRYNQISQTKLILGTNQSRVAQAQNGEFSDFDDVGIPYRIKTGAIYPSGDPTKISAFKYVGFLFRPLGEFRFVATCKIDNYPVQNIAFEEEVSGDILGVDFLLGTSVLGRSNSFAAFRLPIDGIGRGITIDITQADADESVEIYGFFVGYEPAEDSQETL